MARRTSSCAICENSNLASICTVCVNYRIWLGFSTVFSLIFIVIVFDLTLRDGINAPPRDYNIKGSDIDKVFTTIGASASLVFVFNTGMIPEIQATVRQPVVGNMMKALYFQFTIGVLPLYAITFMGYWAYGNDASEYLLNNANGPVWVKAFANMFAFLQSVITSHECVRRRVMKSLANNPYCSEAAAKDAMEAVWDTCYNDTKPFDRAP